MSIDDAVEIVPVERQDIAAIQHIARTTWAETYAGLIPANVQEQLLNSWYSTNGLDEAIRSSGTTFLLAKSERAPVGFAQFVQISPDAAMLSRIYVLPGHQNQKIGSKLLDAAIARLKAAGIQKLLVNVERDNQIGRRFYARKSFTEVAESVADLAEYRLPVVLCERAI